jgi:predicted TPR repeat methyltransferase
MAQPRLLSYWQGRFDNPKPGDRVLHDIQDPPPDDTTQTGDPHRISIDQAISFATALHKDGQVDKAEGLYADILSVAPDHCDALHFLGILNYQRGRATAAIRLIRRALSHCPDYVDARNNLGNILMETGDLEGAEECYRRTVALAPGHIGAHNNLATVLRARGKWRAAEQAFRDALAISSDFHPLHYNLANLLVDQGRIAEAVDHYFTSMVLEPTNVGSRTMLGIALMSLGKRDEAIAHFEKWLAEDRDNPEASHLLAACKGEQIPQRASDAYVKSVFDRFADRFDEQLTHLNYRAPELVTAALTSACGAPAGELDILDAGCGTGLCGALLRPFARRLDGVDLSAGMLKRAAATRHYDALIEAELSAFLKRQTGTYDVIVSADTLCYFGDLDDVFAAAATAVKPGGCFMFTVEVAEPGENFAGSGYCIIFQGRYAHTEAYVRHAAHQAGWHARSLYRDVLRNEMGRPVQGFVVTLDKVD